MGCLGVLFSIDEETVNKLKSFVDDEQRLEFLQEEIEESLMSNEPERFAELEKSWDALHRSLTDGKLEWNNGEFPFNHIIMGGISLYQQDDYIMSLKTPIQVAEIAKIIDNISKQELKNKYYSINEIDYGFELSDEDFNYTWGWFEESIAFWKLAASENRFVLFTVDQ